MKWLKSTLDFYIMGVVTYLYIKREYSKYFFVFGPGYPLSPKSIKGGNTINLNQ